MNLIKRFLAAGGIKIIIFISIVTALQLIVGQYAPGLNFINLNLIKNHLKQPVDVLIFGDSTHWYSPKDDTDKRPIFRIMQKKMPGYIIKSVTQAAYHMEVYEAFCRYIVKHKKKPKIIVIPINLRSFSLEWHKEPHYQFEKQKIVLRGGILRAFYKPLRVLQYKFNSISRKDYLETPVYWKGKNINPIKRMKGFKKQLIMKYMYTLGEEHPKIQSLLKICRLSSLYNLKVIFYVTPIDYQIGEKYLPDEFVRQLNQNIFFIQSQLKKINSSCQLLDFSTDLTSEYFAWNNRRSINEHLDQEGRLYVATKLVEKIRKL